MIPRIRIPSSVSHWNLQRRSDDALPRKKNAPKVRKYDPEYIQWGFVEIGEKGKPGAICVVCQKILVNSSLAPAKLLRHFSKKHANLASRPSSYFELAAKSLALSQKTLTRNVSDEPEEASLTISFKIGQAGEAHTIGERLVKPCLLEAARCLCAEKQIKAFEAIPLSNSTVSRRIAVIGSWLEDEVNTELRSSPCWALQVDESTDVAGSAILLVFVRYLHKTDVEEELLFCKSLLSSTSGEDIFNLINEYLDEKNLSWTNCVDLCTDGATAMTARHKGFVSRVKRISPATTSSHCILHREASHCQPDDPGSGTFV